jgi:hypothetical protein
MAIDIIALNSGNNIKNGSIVVQTGGVSYQSGVQAINSYSSNTPNISNIESEYTNRFDDPSYYYGGGVQLVHGAFSNSGTIVATSGNTAYPIPYTHTDTINSGGIELVDGSKIKVLVGGVYSITWSIQFAKTGGSGANASVWVKKNNIDLERSATDKTFSTGSLSADLFTVNVVLILQKNDYIEIYWSTTDTAVQLEAFGIRSSPVRPVVPSIITTIVQVSNYLG